MNLINNILAVPPYDDELQRLSNSQNVDLGKGIGDFFRDIFNCHISEQFLGLLQILMWVALAALVLYIAYMELGLYDRSRTSDSSEDIDLTDVSGLGTAEDADIRGHNFVREIQTAIANNDYAKAIHLRYLMTIQHLDIQRRIKWMPAKTPMMYVAELKNEQDLLRSMTLTFLYIKYGHYPAVEQTYNDVSDMFKEVCHIKEGKGGEE